MAIASLRFLHLFVAGAKAKAWSLFVVVFCIVLLKLGRIFLLLSLIDTVEVDRLLIGPLLVLVLIRLISSRLLLLVVCLIGARAVK